MLGERALAVLDSLVSGRTEDVLPAELDALVAYGCAVCSEPDLLRRAREVVKAGGRHGARTEAEFRTALEELDERLRSDFHRAVSFSSTLWQEEEDRARLRSVVGTLADPDLRADVEAAVTALRTAAPGAPFHACAGTVSVYAITLAGRCAGAALRVRFARYAKADFREFMKRFRKADQGMAALAGKHQWLLRNLPPIRKGRTSVAVGLLKSGLEPRQAADGYRNALRATRAGCLPVEMPHMATTLVRNAGPARSLGEVAADLDRAYAALCAVRLPAGPVLRGAAKTLLGSPDVTASARRFRNLVDALEARRVRGDDRIRFAARLQDAPGAPETAVERAAAAALAISRPLGEAAVALAAMTADLPSVAECSRRFLAIEQELRHRRAFTGRVPDSAAQLVSVPGTPAEVVELVRQFVAHLPAREFDDRWGMSDDWDVAVAFAKRFAF